MAKIDLRFIDFIDEKNFIKVNKEVSEYGTISGGSIKEDCIRIYSYFEGDEAYIDLDKSTAIKFAKTLRTEINKIK